MKNKISKMIDIITGYTFGGIFRGIFRLKENRVLFISDVNNTLVQNLKCVYDMLDGKKYEKVLALNENRKRYRSFYQKIRTIYLLSTSKYVILDDLVIYTGYIKLRKGQKLCQLWHGAGAFKKFGYSRKNLDLKHIHSGYKKYTNVITSAESIRACYSEAFGVDIKKVKATGIPKTDMFMNNKCITKKQAELYMLYPFLKDKKIILFAPTYRSSNISKAYYDIQKLDLDKLYNALKEDYIVIFKWHPAMLNNIPIDNKNLEKYNDFFMDLSEYRDINDLLVITDILVTDYSSVIFDYFLLNKPIVYFTYDLEEYEKTRGLYYDFDKYIYGGLAKNTDELLKYIKAEDMMVSKRKEFKEEFMAACDGKATQKIIEWIFKN